MAFYFPEFPNEFLAGLALLPLEDGNFHIGFIYQNELENKIKICHLCWHFKLKNEEFNDPKYYCEEVNLNYLNKKFLIASFQNISDLNDSNIPYGFRIPIETYDKENIYVGNVKGEGLTCATFILTVFEKNGYKILNRESWKLREDDSNWQNFIIKHLAVTPGVSPDHLESAKQMIGSVVRFRPDEVFSCAVVDDVTKWDIDFSEAIKMANEIKKCLAS